MALVLSTNFIRPGGNVGTTNEILEKANQQAAPAPSNVLPVNPDSAGSPADTSK
jgi:hypothetical protein